MTFSFCCAPDADIYALFCAAHGPTPRFATAEEAVARAPRGSGVLLFAEGYPDRLTLLTPALFEHAAAHALRLFVEYPSLLPGVPLGAPRYTRTGAYHAVLERTVVTSAVFGTDLPRGRLLMAHDCTIHILIRARSRATAVLEIADGWSAAPFHLARRQCFPTGCRPWMPSSPARMCRHR